MRAELAALLGVALLSGAPALAQTAATPAPTPAETLDLETMMDYFAKSRGVEAEYREEKTLPLLAEPIVSEGVLYFVPPDRLARFTRSPERASTLIDGDRLRIEDSLGVEEIDLASQEVIRQFIDQLLLLFRGDLAELRRHYEVGFESAGESWTLTLTATGFRLRQVIQEISMRGTAGRLEQMQMKGREGELTTTAYGRVVTDRAFESEEVAALFPPEGSPVPISSPDPATP